MSLTLTTKNGFDLLDSETLRVWGDLVLRLRGGGALSPLDLSLTAKAAHIRYGLSSRIGGGDGYSEGCSYNLGRRHHEYVSVARRLCPTERFRAFGHEMGHVMHYRGDLGLPMPADAGALAPAFRTSEHGSWNADNLWGEWVAERFAYELLAPSILLADAAASPYCLATQLDISEGVVRVQLARSGHHAPQFELDGAHWCVTCGDGYAVPVGCACGRNRPLPVT